MSTREEVLKNALAVKAILDAKGISNESVDRLIKEFNSLPSKDVITKFNSLVSDLNSAMAYKPKMEKAEMLLDFYHKHQDELSDRASDMKKLENQVNYNRELERVYKRLEQSLAEYTD